MGTEIIDLKRKCSIDGCKNLGEWDRIKNYKVYRRRICSTHRIKLGYKERNWRRQNLTFQQKYKLRNLCSKCMICGWAGPCDCHRMEKHGRYNLNNVASVCPNCHRLIHRGMLMIEEYREKILELNKAHLKKT